jgi:GntR family transcriptional regulator / MocR family aminotransferase
MEPVFGLPLSIPEWGSGKRLRELHGQLRAAILEGRLQPGLRLPSTRALSEATGVSRNTAMAAYELLLSEGYLAARQGAGTYVADVLPDLAARKPAREPQSSQDRRLNAFWSSLTEQPGHSPSPLEFRLGVPDISHFPTDVWRRLSARALRAYSKAPLAYEEPHGRLVLREAIARYVSYARAVACRADDITVTAGAQQAFDLLARILITPNRTVVAVENPGYTVMRASFAAAGARIVPVPVDEEGMLVERIPTNATVVSVTPSHQFPLGSVLSARRRAALLEFAHARGAVVIEDDYDSEFRFGGRPLDALQTLDRSESVFYVGTFSKSLFPAVRMGFVVAPAWAQSALRAAKRCADSHSAPLTQETLASFITEGHLARHVRRMRRIYAGRREVLLRGLKTHFSRWLEPVPSVAGLHLTALAREAVDIAAVVAGARERGVGLLPVDRFKVGRQGGANGLVFAYGGLDEAGIEEALARLRRVFKK